MELQPLRSAPQTMEPQPLMGVSMSEMRARLQPLGLEHPEGEAMALATAMGIFLLYDAVPDPPVFTAAPPASSFVAPPPRDGTDIISSLTNEVLGLVVSRLPAKDAARTNVLAKRWRSFWCSRSAPLVVVDAHILPLGVPVPAGRAAPGGDDNTSKVAVASVSRVLQAQKGLGNKAPFRCVHLTRCHMASHQDEMEHWLKLLADKGVQEFVFINRPWPLDFPLPATLFGCGAELTSLHLGLWRLPDTAKLRRNTSFPKLRKLVLGFVLMRDRDLAFLLEKSPTLEDLTIIGNLTKVNLRLDHPSLRCVQVAVAGLARIAVVDAPRLERLFMWMTVGPDEDESSRIKIRYAPNLRMLGYWHTGEHALEINSTAIKSQNADEPTGKLNLQFWQEADHIECVQSHLSKLVFQDFVGKRSELAFLKFIAERARALEKMVVTVVAKHFTSVVDVKEMLKPLTSEKWASKDCKLIVFRSPVCQATWKFRTASDSSWDDPFDLSTTGADGLFVVDHSSSTL